MALYTVDVVKRMSITVEANNEDEAVRDALYELNHSTPDNLSEDDVENVERVENDE
jgi:hypothetical protein